MQIKKCLKDCHPIKAHTKNIQPHDNTVKEEMSMYRCLNCGHEFEKPEIEINEIPGVWFDRVDICPNCKVDDIEELRICPMCGEHYISSDKDRCETCSTEVSDWMNEALNKIVEHTGAERAEVIQAISYWVEREG